MADIYDLLKELTRFSLEFKEGKKKYILSSYIKRLDEDRILIEAPSFKGRNFNINDGQTIYINIYTEDGVHSGECKVLGKEFSIISGIWVSYPYNSKLIQRREYLRVPLKRTIDLTIYENAEKTQKREETIHTRDLSGKGFSYISTEQLDNYYDIEAKLHLHDKGEPIVTRCDHIYAEKVKTRDKISHINAFTFLDVESKDVERIIKECFKYQLELRKKGLI